MKKRVVSIVWAVLAIMLAQLTLHWFMYGLVYQIKVWAWVCDLWKPNVWPLVLSVWYWVIPVISSGLWFIYMLGRVLERRPWPKRWFWMNVLLWTPMWFYPMVGALGLLFSFIAFNQIYSSWAVERER